jgi:agmatinase
MLPFLASEFPPAAAAPARWHVIPVPYERSVSYGAGTAAGPGAVLAASQQLEGYLEGFGTPGREGMHTAAPVAVDGTPEEVLSRVSGAVGNALGCGAVPVVLGGEHTISHGCLQAFAERNASLGVVQFDAHADLRAEYQGTRWSHACAMRPVADRFSLPLFQIGVRSLCAEELAARSALGVGFLDAARIADGPPAGDVLPGGFPGQIYITFDVDVFDPSLLPATGTPEPGGLDWWTAIGLLHRVCAGRKLVGCDIVELAPAAGLHHCDYTVAKLAYTLMGLSGRAR